MHFRNAKRWAPTGIAAYLTAIGATLIAFGMRYAAQPVLNMHYPFLFFTIASLLVAFHLGLWPAVLVVISGLLMGMYFFVPPFYSFEIPDAVDVIFIFGYLAVALLGITLIEMLHRAKHETYLLQQVAQSRLEMLERSHTQRSRAEELAKKNEEHFEILASSLPHIWYMRRLDGNFEYFNERFYEYTGLTPGSLDNKAWLNALHPDDVAAVTAAWAQVAEDGVEQTSAFRLRLANGTYQRFEGFLSRSEDKRGKIIKWMETTGTARFDSNASSAVYNI